MVLKCGITNTALFYWKALLVFDQQSKSRAHQRESTSIHFLAAPGGAKGGAEGNQGRFQFKPSLFKS